MELNKFYEQHSTLPINVEKNIIAVFRLAISLNNYLEELLKVKEQVNQVQQQREVLKMFSNNENIDADMVDDLSDICISPLEKNLDDFTGSAKDSPD